MECLHWHIRQFQTLKRDKKAPEEVVVSDDPSDEEGEERHEEELGDKADDGTDRLLEHLGNNVFVFGLSLSNLVLLLYIGILEHLRSNVFVFGLSLSYLSLLLHIYRKS